MGDLRPRRHAGPVCGGDRRAAGRSEGGQLQDRPQPFLDLPATPYALLLDLDGDDDLDAFITGGGWSEGGDAQRSRLYRNDGGTFTDVTANALPPVTAGGGVWGDYDNDGCLDLFLFAESMTNADTLLHSLCDGTFEDATITAGIIDNQSYNPCGDPGNIRKIRAMWPPDQQR